MRALPLLGLAILAAGCTPEAEAPPIAAAAPQAIVQFPVPDYSRHTQIALVQNGQRLRVGDRRELIDELYPAPSRSSRLRELPPGFPPVYVARGWERNDDSEGFGAILYQERVAAAMLHFQSVDAEFVREQLAEYEEALGAPTFIYGERVRYWFWEEPPHTLMVCVYEPTPQDRRMTLMMGDSELLERMGASVQKAQNDRNALEQMAKGRGDGEPVRKG